MEQHTLTTIARRRKRVLRALGALCAALFFPVISYAALMNPLRASSLEQLLLDLLQLVIRIGAIVLAVFVVYVGALFIFARGNSEKLKEARQALIWTLIGGVILIGAQVIAQGIKATVDELGGNSSVDIVEPYG